MPITFRKINLSIPKKLPLGKYGKQDLPNYSPLGMELSIYKTHYIGNAIVIQLSGYTDSTIASDPKKI